MTASQQSCVLPAAVMRGAKRIDLKKIVDKGLNLAKRTAEARLRFVLYASLDTISPTVSMALA